MDRLPRPGIFQPHVHELRWQSIATRQVRAGDELIVEVGVLGRSGASDFSDDLPARDRIPTFARTEPCCRCPSELYSPLPWSMRRLLPATTCGGALCGSEGSDRVNGRKPLRKGAILVFEDLWRFPPSIRWTWLRRRYLLGHIVSKTLSPQCCRLLGARQSPVPRYSRSATGMSPCWAVTCTTPCPTRTVCHDRPMESCTVTGRRCWTTT